MTRVVEVWMGTFGVVCAAIGLSHLMFGTSTVIGGGPVNATIDSDMRFYAVLFVAYGMAFTWCALEVGERARVANALGVVFFAGGVARLLSWASSGRPNWFYVVKIHVELVVPVVNYALLRRALEAPAPPTGGAVI